MNEFYLFLIFAMSALDAMRDGFRSTVIEKITDKQWHALKWLSWYPLMIILLLQVDGILNMVYGVLLGFFGWRWGLLWTGRGWESIWWAKIKVWVKKLFS